MKQPNCFLCGKSVDNLIEIEGERVCSSCSIFNFEWVMLVHIVRLKKEINELKKEIKS